MARVIVDSGIPLFQGPLNLQMSASEFNAGGYFEDVWLTLLNDQLIRMAWGPSASMLFVPELDCPDWDSIERQRAFRYDLDSDSVIIPADYEENLEAYTGHDWDVWGLTRMLPGTKWHQCYRRAGISQGVEVVTMAEQFGRTLANSDTPVVVKDPRMALTMPFLDIECRVVLLHRDPDAVLRSMRRHYGPRLFTDEPYDGFDWVSNHFNYRVPPQAFSVYWSRYWAAMQRSIVGREHVLIDLDRFISGEHEVLEDFLGHAVNVRE